MKNYCAVIRTLGRGGEKYQQLLNSLVSQSIPPHKILVYIADGYPLPKETVGYETYIRCPKGMVAQRSLSFKEVDSDYILFCDDDIKLEESAVEKLFAEMQITGTDCISPNTFPNHKMSLQDKVKTCFYGVYPRFPDGYAFRINQYTGKYSYNNSPIGGVLPSDSAAGPCALLRKSTYKAIHFDDERWLDSFSYALWDDQLFYYKMTLMGFKVAVSFDIDIKHLDGKTAKHGDTLKEADLNVRILDFMIWYRMCFNLQKNSPIKKALCACAWTGKTFITFLYLVLRGFKQRKWFYPCNVIVGIWYGIRLVNTSKFKRIPLFDAYLK